MGKIPVIIIGSSGHSKVVIDIFEKQGIYKIMGLLDSSRPKGEETSGYPVLGNEASLPALLADMPDCQLFIAIGDNWVRQKLWRKLQEIVPTAQYASAIHPSAQVGNFVSIGQGVAVMADAVINSHTRIGAFTIVNTKASIDHDSQLMDFASLAPGVCMGGNVTVGEYSAISIGATVKHGITIGSHSVVGAGSLLLHPCPSHTIMYGVPARVIRSRQIGERYL